MFAALHPHIADQFVEVSEQCIMPRENNQPVFFAALPLDHDDKGGFLSGGPARCLKTFYAMFEGFPFSDRSPADQAGAG
jgi:hypothetical protein